ncbi:Protein hgh1 [Conoideocrella luteorostrata]|uniref:Protein HGH1 homolog n=1 Tax=Conoideocrella luteorostrata TaxID=1105319 RepID=A0AAJ0CBL6_9HYPO|nr:Protein hgh1 [Conoideocrella luteorostrata]
MPTELEELVGFIAHSNPQIRLLATQNLVPYSTDEPAIFKAEELTPIKNLKLLIRDQPEIAEHVLTMLINLSGDPDILNDLAKDDKFIGVVLDHIVGQEEPNANFLAMLLANIAKHDSFKDILQRKQQAPEALGSDDSVMNQLMDLFVKGQDGAYNKKADYDYLAYVFADLAKHIEIRQYFLTEQKYDGVIPLTKIRVFTEHKSDVRRKGVASTIKNAAFDIASHPSLMSDEGINVLPYVLLPITGNEEYDVEDTMEMLPDLQLLSPDKRRDSDTKNIQTHVETLMLLATTREGRDLMRRVKVYPIVRETHLRVDDEDVRDACDRLVQVLMRDEEGEEKEGRMDSRLVQEIDEDDDIVEV